MIRTTPFRLITLHLSQIVLTEALTFILRSFSLIMLPQPPSADKGSSGSSSYSLVNISGPFSVTATVCSK